MDGLGPGGDAEGGIDAGADVLFGAGEFVTGNAVVGGGEDFAVFADEGRGEFFGSAGVDLDAVFGGRNLNVGEVDARARIEVALFERFSDGGGGERRGADNDPAAAGIGELLAGAFENVSVVDTDAVEPLATGEEFVPHLIERRRAAAAHVVDGGMAVENLKELEAFDGHQVAGGDGPMEIGVIDGGESLGGANDIDVALDGGGDGIAVLGLNLGGEVDGVDVDGAL